MPPLTFGSVAHVFDRAWHSLLAIWKQQHGIGRELWEVVPELAKALRAWGHERSHCFLAASAWDHAPPNSEMGLQAEAEKNECDFESSRGGSRHAGWIVSLAALAGLGGSH